MLRLARITKAFGEELDKIGQAFRFTDSTDINAAWEEFLSNVHLVATKLLKTRKRPAVPDIDQSRERMKEDLRRLKRPRIIDTNCRYDALSDYPGPDRDLVEQLSIRQRQHNELVRKKRNTFIEASLSQIEKTAHVSTRINQTCKLIRHLKRTSGPRVSTASVSASALRQEMSSWDHGPISQIPPDHCPMPRAPTLKAIEEICTSLRSGTAPGLDYLFPEFLKVPEVLKICAAFIHQSYLTGKVPEAWRETNIVLLPKVPRPTNFDDLRPIALCSTAYKIYARYLLQELQKFVPPIQEYQSGFLNNRSTDDSLFFISRVADTHWNHRTPLFILTLDLRKAFSQVNIHQLPEILTRRGVPAYLVNRIVDACLHERTQISWQGHTTAIYPKTVGVKQGCPISPYLFVLVLDEILRGVQIKLQEQNLGIELFLGEPEKEIKLPSLSAYADDMTLLSTSVHELNQVMRVLVPELAKYGLNLNAAKCALVLKSNDTNLQTQQPVSYQLGGINVPVKASTVILGVTHAKDMHRRTQIIDRCNKTLRMYYTLIPMLKPLKLEFAFLVRLYRALLMPIMVYGLRHNSFTQANKIILMHREVQMLRGLSAIAHPRPKDSSISQLLKGRTVNRVVTVGKLCFFAHICRKQAQSLLKKSLRYHLGSRRKVGRPIYTFNKYMEKEFRSADFIRPSLWIEAFRAVPSTKALCRELYNPAHPLRDPMHPDAKLFGTVPGNRA